MKGYVNHCQLHSSEYKVCFTCPVRQCKRKLNSYPGLKAHIYRDHQREPQTVVAQQFVSMHEDEIKCESSLCQQICHGIPELLKHLRQHIQEGASVKCPFRQCAKTFNKISSFSSHISRYHQFHGIKNFSIRMIPEEGTSDETQDLNDCSLGLTEGEEYLFEKNLALFYLKLQSKYLLPSSVIQDICQEFQSIHSLGFSYCIENLTSSLTDLNIPEEKIREVLNDMKASDIFMNCNSGPLRTEYCRNTYFKEKFKHVQPQSLMLGRNMQHKKCSFQYVPIIETLKSLLEDDSVWKEYKSTELPVNQGTESCQHCYRDITDGAAFKNNILFKDKPNSLG